jgi:hypothetical protein
MRGEITHAGATQGLHTFVYAWFEMPEVAFQHDIAKLCWNCYGSQGNAHADSNCANKAAFGSIYVGLGDSQESLRAQVLRTVG